MAKKNFTVKTPAKFTAPVSTPVRNTAIPKVAAVPARKEITQADIARRAYEIWQSGSGGSEQDNWARAERELRGA
jgi:hypothetical protein